MRKPSLSKRVVEGFDTVIDALDLALANPKGPITLRLYPTRQERSDLKKTLVYLKLLRDWYVQKPPLPPRKKGTRR